MKPYVTVKSSPDLRVSPEPRLWRGWKCGVGYRSEILRLTDVGGRWVDGVGLRLVDARIGADRLVGVLVAVRTAFIEPAHGSSHNREGPPFRLLDGVERATGIETAWPACAAFREYALAREQTLLFLSFPDSPSHYIAAITYWEGFLSQAWISFDLLSKLAHIPKEVFLKRAKPRY
jgi:hypothetical protein